MSLLTAVPLDRGSAAPGSRPRPAADGSPVTGAPASHPLPPARSRSQAQPRASPVRTRPIQPTSDWTISPLVARTHTPGGGEPGRGLAPTQPAVMASADHFVEAAAPTCHRAPWDRPSGRATRRTARANRSSPRRAGCCARHWPKPGSMRTRSLHLDVIVPVAAVAAVLPDLVEAALTTMRRNMRADITRPPRSCGNSGIPVVGRAGHSPRPVMKSRTRSTSPSPGEKTLLASAELRAPGCGRVGAVSFVSRASCPRRSRSSGPQAVRS